MMYRKLTLRALDKARARAGDHNTIPANAQASAESRMNARAPGAAPAGKASQQTPTNAKTRVTDTRGAQPATREDGRIRRPQQEKPRPEIKPAPRAPEQAEPTPAKNWEEGRPAGHPVKQESTIVRPTGRPVVEPVGADPQVNPGLIRRRMF